MIIINNGSPVILKYKTYIFQHFFFSPFVRNFWKMNVHHSKYTCCKHTKKNTHTYTCSCFIWCLYWNSIWLWNTDKMAKKIVGQIFRHIKIVVYTGNWNSVVWSYCVEQSNKLMFLRYERLWFSFCFFCVMNLIDFHICWINEKWYCLVVKYTWKESKNDAKKNQRFTDMDTYKC